MCALSPRDGWGSAGGARKDMQSRFMSWLAGSAGGIFGPRPCRQNVSSPFFSGPGYLYLVKWLGATVIVSTAAHCAKVSTGCQHCDDLKKEN